MLISYKMVSSVADEQIPGPLVAIAGEEPHALLNGFEVQPVLETEGIDGPPASPSALLEVITHLGLYPSIDVAVQAVLDHLASDLEEPWAGAGDDGVAPGDRYWTIRVAWIVDRDSEGVSNSGHELHEELLSEPGEDLFHVEMDFVLCLALD